jgi:dipeptidyl-peptidase 4
MLIQNALIGVACLGTSLLVWGQTPPEVEIKATNPKFLRDYAETRGFSLGQPVQAVPTPDGKSVLFLRSKPRSPELELYEFNLATSETRLLITPAEVLKGTEEVLSAEEKALRERMRVSMKGFTDFKLSKDGLRILLSLSGKLYVLERATKGLQELKTAKGTLIDAKFSPDGKSVSYVLGHDVYAFDLTSGREQRVTLGGTELVSHGLAEFVAREEMLRFSGYWWSPDSKFIAYQETDNNGVEIWHVADSAKPEDPPYDSFYPRPGKANAKVRLGIIPVTGGDTVWVDWDRERYPYLTTVRWEQHGPLTIAVQTRDQKELLLLKVDAQSGPTTTLIRERDDAWVNVRQDVPRWLGAEKGFLWLTEKRGGWQLEWRNADGTLNRSLLPDTIGFKNLGQVDAVAGRISFSARPNPTECHLYQMNLADARPIPFGQEPGWHDGTANEKLSLFVESFASPATQAVARVFDANGRQVTVLPSVAEKCPSFPNLEITRVESGGTTFDCGIVRPKTFRKGLRYPVIDHVYGGPLPDWYAGTVVSTLGPWLLPQWLADQGFIVVSIDGRGTPGRGHGWERAINKRFGSVPLEDQVRGLKALAKKFPEMDLERVGIYGWSFGGYLSALAVLREPNTFKTAVAGAPVTDWLDYDTHYTERYLGMPDTDIEAYQHGSLLPLAKDLKRPLLLIHGTSDDNVYFRHSLKLANELFRTGKTFDFLPLASFTHMVPDPVVNERLYSRIAHQFIRDLGQPKKRN